MLLDPLDKVLTFDEDFSQNLSQGMDSSWDGGIISLEEHDDGIVVTTSPENPCDDNDLSVPGTNSIPTNLDSIQDPLEEVRRLSHWERHWREFALLFLLGLSCVASAGVFRAKDYYHRREVEGLLAAFLDLEEKVQQLEARFPPPNYLKDSKSCGLNTSCWLESEALQSVQKQMDEASKQFLAATSNIYGNANNVSHRVFSAVVKSTASYTKRLSKTFNSETWHGYFSQIRLEGKLLSKASESLTRNCYQGASALSQEISKLTRTTWQHAKKHAKKQLGKLDEELRQVIGDVLELFAPDDAKEASEDDFDGTYRSQEVLMTRERRKKILRRGIAVSGTALALSVLFGEQVLEASRGLFESLARGVSSSTADHNN